MPFIRISSTNCFRRPLCLYESDNTRMNCKIIEEFFTLRLFICNFSAQSHHFNIFFMKSIASVQLSLMMFLEYFIWGSWYVTMSTYMGKNLHSTGIQIGAAYSALAIATMISPFIVGL